MNEKIHQYLDGDLPLEELTPRDREELEAYQAFLNQASLLREQEPIPDLTASVMARIEKRESAEAQEAATEAPGLLSGLERLARRIWEPRPIRMRPAWGIVGAAALLVLMLVVPGETPVLDVAVDEREQPTQIFVQFRLDAPEASNVQLAGTFTGWEAEYPMQQNAPGVWTILVPLEPGVHEYAFVVDGQEWRPDPWAPRVDDGFGGHNSRVAVMPPNFNSL
jgi:hypothetical protein